MTTDTTPMLASAGVLLRGDGQMLLVRHAAGPFAGRWSMPLVAVAPSETAQDALERLLRGVLRVRPGPLEFLDTFELAGEIADGADRLVVNAFSCLEWAGEATLAAGPYDDAAWAPPGEASTLDLLPEVRDWIAAQLREIAASTPQGDGHAAAHR